MPELDDDVLFGDAADRIDDDDALAARDGDDDEPEDEEQIDLEGQFDEETKADKPAEAAKGDKGGDRTRGGDSKTVTLSAKEFRELQQKAREVETEREYWRGRADAKGKPGPSEDDEEDEAAPPVRKAKPATSEFDGETKEDFLKDINNRGKAALAERGFISRGEVEALIEERARAIAEKTAGRAVKQATEALHSDAQLIRQYPDLNKADSEFSARVAKEVRSMVQADPALRKSNATIAAAARIVDAEMKLEQREKRSTDASRERRIAKQGPSSARRESESESYMSPLQRQMLGPAMKAFGVSEKAYAQERAKLERGNRR
jgi:hypothetical protein